MMWTAGIQMKWVCDHRSESQFKQLRNSPKKKIFGASTGFEPAASALALQRSPSWAMKTHTLEGWPIYWVHQPVKGMKHWMKWCELREYKWNEYVTIAGNHNLSNCENSHILISFVFPQFISVSFSVSFLSRVDELNKSNQRALWANLWMQNII